MANRKRKRHVGDSSPFKSRGARDPAARDPTRTYRVPDVVTAENLDRAERELVNAAHQFVASPSRPGVVARSFLAYFLWRRLVAVAPSPIGAHPRADRIKEALGRRLAEPTGECMERFAALSDSAYRRQTVGALLALRADLMVAGAADRAIRRRTTGSISPLCIGSIRRPVGRGPLVIEAWDGRGDVEVENRSLRFVAGVPSGGSVYFRRRKAGGRWIARDIHPVVPAEVDRRRQEKQSVAYDLSQRTTSAFVRFVPGGGPGTGKRR